ncbi:hypothetical protein HKD37_18G050108 [Glycine soja]
MVQEMREVKNKLILAREQPWRRTKAKASLSAWMDVLINSGSEVEHEAFLATWLSMIGFSSIGLVSTLVFPIAVHLGRGNPIALGPAVLASLYKDLTLLKNTVVGMTEQLVLGYKLELEVTLQSPFYLVQIWVWERFKNLQPQPRLNNHEDPMMFRCHKVKALKIDNVRLALDSAMKKYAGKFKVFYSENENLVLLNTDLDKEPTGLLRISLLVGIKSTIKKPMCDGNLYFPARLFEGDITTLMETICNGSSGFCKEYWRKRSPRSPQVSKANKNGNDADVPPGSPPKLGTTVCLGKSGDDDSNARKCKNDVDVPSGFLFKSLKTVHSRNSAQDDYENVKRISPLTKLVAKDTVEPLMGGLEEDFEDTNRSKDSRLSSDRVSLSGTQGESYTFASGINVMDLEQIIYRLETVYSSSVDSFPCNCSATNSYVLLIDNTLLLHPYHYDIEHGLGIIQLALGGHSTSFTLIQLKSRQLPLLSQAN